MLAKDGSIAGGIRTTKESGNDVTKAFLKAVETQAAFWDALSELESLIGQELDGSEDLSSTTLEDLLADGEK